MINDLELLFNYLSKQRRIDFSGYSHTIVEKQLKQRLSKTKTENISEYYEYLQSHQEEIDTIIDALIINVSSFFRDTLVFNYLSSKILPELICEKAAAGNNLLRIWSAGCATGEEPYSIAMEINKLLKNVTQSLTFNIFATDIDNDSIQDAQKAVYPSGKMENVRFEYLKHFDRKENSFSLESNIKHLVNFSIYNLLDKKTYSPPESLYGDFDIVFCRNVLIYYNTEYQNQILTKLYRSLNENGYLVLGESETPTRRFHDSFRKVNECCHIFQKVK